MNYNIQTPSVAMSKQASIYVVMRSFLIEKRIIWNLISTFAPENEVMETRIDAV